MTYVEVPQEEVEKKMQSTYKYMPVFIARDGAMVRVIAQENGVVYYTKE